MRVGLRSAALGILSPVAAATLAMGTAAPSSAGIYTDFPTPAPTCTETNKCTALMLGGTLTGKLTDDDMKKVLDGYFSDDSVFTRQNVQYPGSVDWLPSIGIGSILLYGAIDAKLREDPDAQIVITGFSQGSAVADQVMYRLLLETNVPKPENLRFVLVADPSRSPNSPGFLAPDTPYHITVINTEYDGFSDYPDRWWNGVAAMNATLGIFYLHLPTLDVNLEDVPEENITVTYNKLGGSVTHYLVPTETLPLVRFMPFLAPYEDTLRTIIDRGYSRNDDKGQQDSLRTAQRTAKELDKGLDVGVDENLQTEDAEGSAKTGSLTEPVALTEQTPTVDPAPQVEQPAAEEPTVSDDAAAAGDEAAAEATTGKSGSHRAKRGSERNSVASIKTRLADEAKSAAKAETKREVNAESQDAADSKDSEDSKSEKSETANESDRGGSSGNAE